MLLLINFVFLFVPLKADFLHYKKSDLILVAAPLIAIDISFFFFNELYYMAAHFPMMLWYVKSEHKSSPGNSLAQIRKPVERAIAPPEMWDNIIGSTQLRNVAVVEDSKCPHEELKDILRRALKAKSAKERKRLQREGMLMMKAAPEECFWKGKPPQYREDLIYIEAVAETWDYFERKIYGQVRGGEAYDPEKGSPFKLWNKTCKKRYMGRLTRERQLINPTPKSKNPDEPFNIDDLPRDAENIPRLELIRREFEIDPTGELKSSFVRQNPPPPITAQDAFLVIYDLVSRGEKWTNKILAEHFNIPPGAMNSAWSRTLNPLLKKIGDRILANLDLEYLEIDDLEIDDLEIDGIETDDLQP